MTKKEEIDIILKRIPEQQIYLANQVRNYYNSYLERDSVPEKIRRRSLERHQELYDSAQGVFDNLIKRLNELVCQKE